MWWGRGWGGSFETEIEREGNKAGLMVLPLQAPKPLVHLVQNIYVYIFVHTAGHTHMYIYIYIQRDKEDRTHDNTYTCSHVSQNPKKNQNSPIDSMHHRIQTCRPVITKMGRHATASLPLVCNPKHAAETLTLARKHTKHSHSRVAHCESD